MKDILITVPYRNRPEHLEKFLKIVPDFFKSRNITFDIVICELNETGDWNAGLCNNSIIHYLNNITNEYKYIYIHHVDIYPIDGEVIFPQENECIFNLGDYGSCILSLENFLKCGGCGNSFWGWGSEDNDLYKKLQKNGIRITNNEHISPKKIIFDVDFQNHPRPFVAKNYASNMKLLYTDNMDGGDINNFNEYATVEVVERISENIFKQLIKPLTKSPREAINKKAVLTYIEGHTSFDYITTLLKSSILYSANEYDIIVFAGNLSSDSSIVSQTIAHGGTVINHNKIININGMAGVERFYAYRDFLETNTQYEEILHVDAADVVFLDNPFKYVQPNKINFIQEDILHMYEPWNSNMLKLINYSTDVINKLSESPVICSGVIYAPVELFIKLATGIINEYESKFNISYYGVDQPILNKLIYNDDLLKESELVFKTTHDDFCINLHTPINNNQHYYGSSVDLPIDFKQIRHYSIIHQYNRSQELNTMITDYHKHNFFPLRYHK